MNWKIPFRSGISTTLTETKTSPSEVWAWPAAVAESNPRHLMNTGGRPAAPAPSTAALAFETRDLTGSEYRPPFAAKLTATYVNGFSVWERLIISMLRAPGFRISFRSNANGASARIDTRASGYLNSVSRSSQEGETSLANRNSLARIPDKTCSIRSLVMYVRPPCTSRGVPLPAASSSLSADSMLSRILAWYPGFTDASDAASFASR